MHALIDGETRIAADAEAFQSFFEVLPHALRDPDLRGRVAALYEATARPCCAVSTRPTRRGRGCGRSPCS